VYFVEQADAGEEIDVAGFKHQAFAALDRAA